MMRISTMLVIATVAAATMMIMTMGIADLPNAHAAPWLC
jgi:hypothetical protein